MTYADQLGQAVMMATGSGIAFKMGRDWDEYRDMLDRRRQRKQDRKDQTVTLREFLLARLKEHEAAALAGLHIEHPHPDGYWLGPFTDYQTQRGAELLHEMTRRADRGIRGWFHDWRPRAARVHVLKLAAAHYQDHPDYQEEWKP